MPRPRRLPILAALSGPAPARLLKVAVALVDSPAGGPGFSGRRDG